MDCKLVEWLRLLGLFQPFLVSKPAFLPLEEGDHYFCVISDDVLDGVVRFEHLLVVATAL